MQQSHRATVVVVAFCFFISGMAGLIYQLVWMRYLALFLGHTSYAVMAVLAAFMGGLAIGNALFGGWVDRAAKPLALYGWLECGIGLYALFFPAYFQFSQELFIHWAKNMEPGGTGALGLKFGFSFASVLLPAILMGATLPVMTRFITRSLSELRDRVAALYAINSAGAVAGCIVSDFWWIPTFGLEFTVFGAAAFNLIAALLSFWISVQTGERVSSTNPNTAEVLESESTSVAERRWILWAIGLSGFVAMLYEIAWTRLLALALGSSTHAFSIMLITFISGIATGAVIIYRWKSLRSSLRTFAWAELALAGTVLVSMCFYDSIPYWFLKLTALLSRREEAFPLYQLLQAGLCFAVMFIPTVCLGLTLPLASRIVTVELAQTGRSVGRVFAVNTLGTVLGTVATALLLMPQLGLARTFAVGVGLNALIGILILKRATVHWRNGLSGLIGVALFAWFVGALFTDRWQATFALGFWRREEFNMTKAEFRQAALSKNLKYFKDGAGSTVAVASLSGNGGEELALAVNGKVDASTSGDMPTQFLIGHIPMLLHSNATHALVVGLGSGMTANAVTKHASLERVDVVEISPEVVEAARHFSEFNDRVHTNDRVHIVIDDAKSFLKTTPQQYDVIISEPSNPWMAGVAGVFTQEYYQNCRERLRPNGLMIQWLQTYETDDATFDLVLRTFRSVFPAVSIWQPAGADVVLIGGDSPAYPSAVEFMRRFQQPAIRTSLARIGIDQPVVLLTRELASWEHGGFLADPNGPIHTDFFPELEYRAQRAFFVRRSAVNWMMIDENFRTRPSTLLGAYLREFPLTEMDAKALSSYYLSHRVPGVQLMHSLLLRWRRDFPGSTVPLMISTKLSGSGNPAEMEVEHHRSDHARWMALADTDPLPLQLYATYLLRSQRLQRSALYQPAQDELTATLRRLMETDPRNLRVYQLHLAELAWDRGDDEECLKLGQQALEKSADGHAPDFSSDPTAPVPVLSRMLEIYGRTGKRSEAAALAQLAEAQGYAEREIGLLLMCRKADAANPAVGYGQDHLPFPILRTN